MKTLWIDGHEVAADALLAFTRLHHRVEPVGKASGVQYVDDSKATNPESAIACRSGPSIVATSPVAVEST